MEMLQGFWKQHLRPRAAVGYGVKIFLPSPPNYVTRSPGGSLRKYDVDGSENVICKCNFAFLQSFLNYSKSLRLQNVF